MRIVSSLAFFGVDKLVHHGPMRALVGRDLEPRQYFVRGDEIIDKATIGRSAAPSLNFTRLGPDISIDKRCAFVRPALRVHLRIFEGLVDIAVIEEGGPVRDAISVRS